MRPGSKPAPLEAIPAVVWSSALGANCCAFGGQNAEYPVCDAINKAKSEIVLYCDKGMDRFAPDPPLTVVDNVVALMVKVAVVPWYPTCSAISALASMI